MAMVTLAHGMNAFVVFATPGGSVCSMFEQRGGCSETAESDGQHQGGIAGNICYRFFQRSQSMGRMAMLSAGSPFV